MPPPPPRRVVIVQGHPEPGSARFGHALAQAYAEGAHAAGHDVCRVDVAALEFPLLRSQHDWLNGGLPPGLAPAQRDLLWAEHVALFFPLWLGDMPALLKGFLEQVMRPDLGGAPATPGTMPPKALKGRSARIVVTMGMPALVYRYYFRAHSLKSLERNVLGIVGIAPVHETLVGSVEQLGETGRAKWLSRLRKLGRDAG